MLECSSDILVLKYPFWRLVNVILPLKFWNHWSHVWAACYCVLTLLCLVETKRSHMLKQTCSWKLPLGIKGLKCSSKILSLSSSFNLLTYWVRYAENSCFETLGKSGLVFICRSVDIICFLVFSSSCDNKFLYWSASHIEKFTGCPCRILYQHFAGENIQLHIFEVRYSRKHWFKTP